jgi:hypothetical protein
MALITRPPRHRQKALLYASRDGDLEVVQALLAAGVDVATQDEAGNTALILATCSKCLEVVQVLLAAGADGSVALIIASSSRRPSRRRRRRQVVDKGAAGSSGRVSQPTQEATSSTSAFEPQPQSPARGSERFPPAYKPSILLQTVDSGKPPPACITPRIKNCISISKILVFQEPRARTQRSKCKMGILVILP